MIARPLGALLLAMLAGCSQDDGPKRAMHTFQAFQEALQGQDVESCRGLLTVESQQVLAEMPWDAISQRQPLHIVSAQRKQDGRNEFSIRVEDPNNHGATAQFVVVKEYGRMVVDLVASAGRNAQVVEASGSKQHLEPRQLTPADHERIREFELSQPLRLKAGGN